MLKDGYYSSGELAALTHVTKKTIRYYDEHNILKPSFVTSSGARFYTDQDLARLTQILLLKSLGFSLKDIKEMTASGTNLNDLKKSLHLQLNLVNDRMEQLSVISKTLSSALTTLEQNKPIHYPEMMAQMNLLGFEQRLKTQYQNAANVTSRIHLHELYSQNKQGWFPFVFSHCPIKNHMSILELGCGDGTFWKVNESMIPKDCNILCTDISEGMLRDAKDNLSFSTHPFSFQMMDCEQLSLADDSMDCIIANHVLFYCNLIPNALKEIKRVLKPNKEFVCSTYGKHHMEQISELVQGFDDRIRLSKDKLYERFGKENGGTYLQSYFSNVSYIPYEDELIVTSASPLILYILSCHGNQNQYILDRFQEFETYVENAVKDGFHITKDAGIFCCH